MATTDNTEDLKDNDRDDLRDTLEAAFKQHATDEVDDKPAAEPAAPAAPAAAPADDKASTGRDASGRFAPKTPAEGAQTAQAPAVPAAQADGTFTPAPQPAELKPPASWTPQAREKWASLTPEIRAEVHRREGEMQTVLQKSAGARQFVDAFENVVRPYELFIRQENSNPLQAVQNLMSTAAMFRTGTPHQKADLVAGMIRNFGIDIEMLDTMLAGQTVAPGVQPQAASQQFRDPRFDQFIAAQQQLVQQTEQRQMQEVHQEVARFAEKHEFYSDVQGLMADLMAVKAKQGQALDLEGAYKLACAMHEGVAATLAQRATTAQNPGQSQAVLRAKRAAASIKGDPTPHSGATVPKDDSVRSSIEAAIESLRQ